MQVADASTLSAAAAWIQATLLGPIATSLAILAVAAVGMLMLAGHMDWRRGARTTIGCFILFGAPAIAAGLMSAADYRGSQNSSEVIEPSSVSAPIQQPSPSSPQTICWNCSVAQPNLTSDPYSGAAVGN